MPVPLIPVVIHSLRRPLSFARIQTPFFLVLLGTLNTRTARIAKTRPEEGILRLRKELGLYANIRPLKVYQPLIHKSPIKEKVIKNTDFVIYRELHGGIYYGDKMESQNGDSASDTCLYSAQEVDRIAHLAFKAARTRRKKLTLVDKANVLATSRLWRTRVKEIAKTYPDVSVDYLYVDNAAMKILLNPRQFDVILTDNMFGDILSDESSVISGSIGLLASTSLGDKSVLFEPIHGSFSDMKGKDLANPLATILSVALLLDHFKLHEEADAIRNAAEKSIELNITTPDINATKKFAKTSVVGDFISEYIIDKKSVLYKVGKHFPGSIHDHLDGIQANRRETQVGQKIRSGKGTGFECRQRLH